MSTVTTLAEGQLTAAGTITVELVEADETPTTVIVRWPSQPSVLHPRRFPAACGRGDPDIRCCSRSVGSNST
jgi:hypothetical protein